MATVLLIMDRDLIVDLREPTQTARENASHSLKPKARGTKDNSRSIPVKWTQTVEFVPITYRQA